MSANVGGYIRGPWWRYLTDAEDETRRCYVIAWGNLVKTPSEKFNDLRCVKFAIKTGRGAGRAEKHLVCTAYGENICTAVMRSLEKGDVVFAAGTWVEKLKAKTKKGVHPTYEMQVHFIVSLDHVALAHDIYNTPAIMDMIRRRKDDAPDDWLSD